MGNTGEYPSIRKALRGEYDEGVANLWCAVKWITWHLIYALIALTMVVFAIVIAPLYVVYRIAKNEKVGSVFSAVGSSIPAGKIAWALDRFFVAMLAIVSAGVISFVVYGLIYNTTEMLRILGTTFAVFLGFVALFLFLDKVLPAILRLCVRYGGSVREKSMDKPITRRVLGYCPVSIKMEPRWFEKIFG